MYANIFISLGEGQKREEGGNWLEQGGGGGGRWRWVNVNRQPFLFVYYLFVTAGIKM